MRLPQCRSWRGGGGSIADRAVVESSAKAGEHKGQEWQRSNQDH
jgi:hypothetical protein